MSTRVESPEFISPEALLRKQAAEIDRHIERAWWFKNTNIDLDLPNGEDSLDPFQKAFVRTLSDSIQRQGHKQPGVPSPSSDMILGFHTIPSGPEPITERVQEIEPLVINASHRYDFNALKNKYVAVVTLEDDIAHMPKRKMETAVRTMMVRIGAFSIQMINPKHRYFAFATMDGGLGVEFADRVGVIDRVRDRLVTFACAKEAGSFEKVYDAISEDVWSATEMPDYMANAFRSFGKQGYVPAPFEISAVASHGRTSLVQQILGYSRQAESATAAEDPHIRVPLAYRMGQATGAIITTVTGRIGADKRDMDRDRHFVTVSIVPKKDYRPGKDDPLSLYGFQRYALFRPGYEHLVPSIEFDEMAAAIMRSPLIRVSKHPKGHGYKKDPEGDIVMHRVRGFIHLHQGIEKIYSRTMWGRNTLDLIEYIQANLREYPYQVGCGKDLMFACSTDATARSKGAQDPNSGIAVAFFDAILHGKNGLLFAEPIPGTDYIPENPYEILMPLIDREQGVIELTDELAQI